MGGGKGSADSSGMAEALASAKAADQAYALGEQQLQWSKDTWNQEQPLMTESEQSQIALAAQQEASMKQMQAESANQWNQYESTYAPMEQKFAGEAQNWASPENVELARGKAMGDVATQGNAELNTAANTLKEYGVDPSSGKYASLFTGAMPMIGASEAAAGTTAAQNLKMQQMELEGQAINTGRGLVNDTGSLTGVGTGAGSASSGANTAAAGTANENLLGGSTAMTAPTNWFNAGTGAMNSYVGAVNGYNEAQLGYARSWCAGDRWDRLGAGRWVRRMGRDEV